MPFSIQHGQLLPYTHGLPVLTLTSDSLSYPLDSSFPFDSSLGHYLSGKELLLSELPFPVEPIISHITHGFIQVNPSLLKKHRRFFCRRCANEDQTLFGTYWDERISEEVTYCRTCLLLGKASEIEPLLSWSGPKPKLTIQPDLHFSYPLTPSQQQASNAVIQAIENNESLLLFAVTGAGKTEMLFQGIERALQDDKRVVLAIPRVDVVHELTPRLQEAFPHVPILSLYGGSKETPTFHPLTIATTHQLLRYTDAFDVVMIDEVDAFPYSVSPMLHYAVKKAKTIHASTIYLSATPSKQIQKEVTRTITIPARYHRHPLLVPRFVWCGAWKKLLKKGRLPKQLLRFLHERKQTNTPVFLFVPSLDDLQRVTQILQTTFSGVDSVHAGDEKRKEKVAAFREGRLQCLVTTTILERGVTVKGLEVAVLGAEDRIFTEAALVQIAGRVGRKKEAPKGEVIFFHHGLTTAMLKAKEHIQHKNKLAKKAGWIDEA